MSSSSSSNKFTLLSSDGEAFEVEEAIALQSQTIKHMIEDDCAANGIPLPNVSSEILPKIIEYCKKHVIDSVSDEISDGDEKEEGKSVLSKEEVELKKWDADFINVDQAVLYDLLLASNYLNIKGLLDLAVQRVADMIKGKTPEQIRETFNIKNDFTPEEEEEIRKENAWAFE